MALLGRLLLPAIFLFASVILKGARLHPNNGRFPLFWALIDCFKAHITYPTVLRISRTLPVFAGLTPFNVTGLTGHVLAPSVVCIYFVSWVSSIQDVSKYVVDVDPWHCRGDNCNSVYLPGGIEQMRKLGSDLNQTILQGELFKDADALITHNTSGYHLDFFPPAGGFRFADGNGCQLYGKSRAEAVYMCIGSDADKNLVAGMLPCLPIEISLIAQVGVYAQALCS